MSDLEQAHAAVAEWPISVASIAPVSVGLINRTYRVERRDGRPLILQRVNPIFTPLVHDDIEAVTSWLERKQVLTPRLLRTKSMALCAELASGVWRLMTYVDGDTVERLATPDQARAAGRFLARFHGAIAD